MSLVDTLAWLVDIPSVTGDEAAIADAVEARLAAGPRPVTRRGNTLVVGDDADRRRRLLLVGHLDTVPSQGQGPARVEGGRLWGLGAADMKAGLAVMIHLLEDEELLDTEIGLVGVFYEGEEGPAAGNSLGPTLEAFPWLTDAWFAVVLEPSDAEVQVGCNGAMNVRVVFRGSSAHSARPWLGENAITKAGSWLARMHRLEPREVDLGGLVYREVMSVTRARGGIATNIIPAEFTLNLNYRFTPDRTIVEAERRVREVCAAADEVEIVDVAPAGPVEVDHPFVRTLVEVSNAPLTAKQGWTDVARLGAYGVPAVNYGPGETARAHQVAESVEVVAVEEAFRRLRAAILHGARSTQSS